MNHKRDLQVLFYLFIFAGFHDKLTFPVNRAFPALPPKASFMVFKDGTEGREYFELDQACVYVLWCLGAEISLWKIVITK